MTLATASTPFLRRLGDPANDNEPVTINDAGSTWLTACRRRGLERSTLRQYEQHLNYHINPLVGPLPLTELTTPIVQRLVDELTETRGSATAKKALSSLKSLLTEAQRVGQARDNVASPVTVRRSRRGATAVRIPETAEVRATIAAADAPWKALIVTAAMTGLRASELRGLGWAHVDLGRRVIEVRRRADRWNALGPPKSSSGARSVPFGVRLADILAVHKERCPRGELDLVFPNGRGRVEALSNIWRRGLAPAERRAGVVDEAGKPKFSLHGFRHFAASLFIASRKFTPKEVQVMIGHASIVETFDVYGHLFAKRDDIGVVMQDVERMVFED